VGGCHIAQYQIKCILGLTEKGEMDKTSNGYYFSGNLASPNQHVTCGRIETQATQATGLGRLLLLHIISSLAATRKIYLEI